MSDNLVETLRFYADDSYPYLTLAAADRIEELEDNLASMAGLWSKSDSEKQLVLGRIEELEAKLAEYNLLWQAYELDKVVAELKGQDDE